MTQRLDDVWVNRDYPVLREVTRRIDQGQRPVPTIHVAEAIGLPVEEVALAAAALERRGLVEVLSTYAEGPEDFIEVSGEAYLLTGLHPSGDDALSSLVAALRQAADLEPDPAEKGRLRAAADGLLNVSRGVATGVLTAWLTQQVT